MLALAESSIQLVPDASLLLHLATVLVMVFVLNRTLFKPINYILAERERRTGGRRKEALELMKSVEEKLRLWEQGLREARNEGYRLLETERAMVLKDREARLSELKADLAAKIATEKAKIQGEALTAKADLEVQARHLAREISTQILGRSVSSNF
jgi:F-type H+-transporting ATPase subunit b